MAAGRKNNNLAGDMDILNDLTSFNKPVEKKEDNKKTSNSIPEVENEKKVLSGKKILMQLSIDEVDKKEWASFFSERRMSLSAGVRRAVEYFITHVKNGDIELN